MSATVATQDPPVGNTVVRNIATLGAGELISRLIGFIATIYIARRLGVEAYGIIGIGFAVLLYATAAVDAGLEHTGPREVVDRRAQLATLVPTLLVVRFFWSLAVTVLLLVGTSLIFSGTERNVVALYVIALLPVGLNLRWLHIGLERTALVSLARVIAELVRVTIVLLLVRGPADLYVVPLAQLAGDALAATLLASGIRATGVRLRWRVERQLAEAVFRRAAPMAASALLALLIYNADLLFLRAFRDAVDVGLYLAGYTLINFLGILGHVVALTLVPAFTRLHASPRAQTSLYQDAMAQTFAAGLPIAAGGCLVAPLLIDIVFGAEYAAAAPVLAVLIWTMPVVLLRSVLQAMLIARGDQQRVLRATLAAAVANVGLNLIAVPTLGMLGAALTTVIAELVRMLATLRHVRAGGMAATPLVRFARSSAAAAAMAALLLIVRPTTLWTALPLGVAVYGIVLAAAGGLRLRDHRLEVTV